MLYFAVISSPKENENTKTERYPQLESYIAKTAEGDTEALAMLYEQTKGAVYGFALSILKNAHDAEDVLQDTYVRVYNYAHAYRASGNPMAWMLEITKNLAYMLLRKKSREGTVSDDEPERFFSEDFSHDTAEALTVTQAMLKLSDTERQIITLHAVTGLKHREIAKLLGMPLATVLSKYNRSLKKLKDMLEE